MFGRQPRLPVDLAFKLPVSEGQHSSHSEYVQNLKSRLKESYKIAMEKAAKIALKNKTRFDKHVTASDLEPGDRVLVRNVRIRGKHKISDKWEPTVHVVVRRAGTLPVYTVKPETGDGPLRTLHRDLLLPCGYLPEEQSSEPVQKPVQRRPGTRANPVVEEDNSSDEEDDVLIPVWLSSPVPMVSEIPVHPDLPMTDVQDTQHIEPPGPCPVESPVNAHNDDNPPDVDNSPELDNPPELDNLPDMSSSTSDGPLMAIESNSHQSDTEYLPTDRVTPTEQVDEPAFIQNDLPEDDHSEIQGEQLPVEEDGLKGAEPEDGKDETIPMDTEEKTDTNDSVRRSERNRQPPRRLDYTELGNPLITAVKSFFQGLSTAWAEVISEGEEPVQPPALTPQIIIIQPSTMHRDVHEFRRGGCNQV